MSKILSILLFFMFVRCDKPKVNAENVLVGEWRYVGTFSNAVDYLCYICDDFDYNKSIYRINFADANNYMANINLLLAKGEYNVSLEQNEDYTVSGTFENINMQILNKPTETLTDSKIKTMLLESTAFHISLKPKRKGYDVLTLGTNNSEYLLSEYLLFVRK